MRVGVRERSKTVVILLTSSIPKGQLDVLAINLDIGDVVLEDGGDVDLVEMCQCTASLLSVRSMFGVGMGNWSSVCDEAVGVEDRAL
jgi:hypothetical protein